MKALVKESRFGAWLERSVFNIPPGLRLLNFIVQRVFRINGSCRFQVHYTSQVRQGHKIMLGSMPEKCLAVMSNCNLQAENCIEIGEGTIFASGLSLISANHDLYEISKQDPALVPPIRIGEKCWIGCNVTILPGVSIGDGSIVAAGSVVTKSVPKKVVVAGIPARVIREL